jgi:hypothetical protein
MPYAAYNDIKALIPAGWLLESLDDDSDGTEESFAGVLSAAEDAVNGVLSTQYAVPLASPENYPFLKHVTRYEVARICYSRRGYDDKGFPHFTIWDSAWKQLVKIGAGDLPLGPVPEGSDTRRSNSRGAVILGTSKTYSSSGSTAA